MLNACFCVFNLYERSTSIEINYGNFKLNFISQGQLDSQGIVPTFVHAHTFCASHKVWFKCGWTGVEIDAIHCATKNKLK